MASNWLKMRHDLLDAPEIRRIAKAAAVDTDAVFGKLFRLWSWADRHGIEGELGGVDLDDVDNHVGSIGFGAALVGVGWLTVSDAGIVIPHWDRHNSESAKTRGLAKNRIERFRGKPVTQGALHDLKQCNAPRVTREEEIREDIPLLPLPPPREIDLRADWAALRQAWASGTGKPWRSARLPDAAHERLSDPSWLAEAVAAIQRLPACKLFATPVTLHQLCGEGFVAKLLGGAFDAARGETPQSRMRHPTARLDDRAPPQPFDGKDLAAFERTKKMMAKKLREMK